jgi:aminopeptidase N
MNGLRLFVLSSLLLLVALPVEAQVERIDLEVDIDPGAGTLDATAQLVVAPPQGTEAVEVLLNRRLAITEVRSDVGLVGFEHVLEGDGPYRYAAQATPVRLRLAAPADGGSFRIRLKYRGAVEPDAWGVIQLHERWVELVAAYSGWIPLDPSTTPFAASWRARLPDDWVVAGTGSPGRSGGWWKAAVESTEDLVLIAAPGLHRMAIGDSISISHVDLPQGVPELIAADAKRVRDTFSQWFGPTTGEGRVEIVFAQREKGGGYARPGLVVMLYQGAYAEDSTAGPGFIRYLAHEISHLWWRGARTTDWQDWLNESFAEMSALMILRDEFGEQEFEDRLARYREASAAAPPVRGIDRDEETAYTVLYQKGPVLLAELEQSIGREAFLRFLRARIEGAIVTNDGCLDTLEQVVSVKARNQLDAALDR